MKKFLVIMVLLIAIASVLMWAFLPMETAEVAEGNQLEIVE